MTRPPSTGQGTRPAGPSTISGSYADPAVVMSDGRYYVYPTTDGRADWGADAFRVLSSVDLIEWEDHGEVLRLGREVQWADRRAWAPAALVHGGKVYLYFTADENIGVAVADHPTGPFQDIGHPLVERGQFPGTTIDPAVFVDDDGAAYLYWGNGVLHGVRLADDLVSFDPAEVRSWEPPGFREAGWVHRRGAIYYLSWSENDTREEDYRVRYATGPGPFGPWTHRGVLLEKELSRGIRGTGHHAILRLPGLDAWLIAYHRFAVPDGDGYHRELVFDELRHRPDGLLEPVRNSPDAFTYPLTRFATQ
ncbi:family 43 glycosylhydrolase [Actinotalea sp. K2]|uniref:family 43 glycosylhydrolase n=1 Tax=Actinotalea sp. K2 TaxID=2939438 RepID=UPI002016AE38|nr:family 43 glycosylhydrolase [Actinotalea sp. K2]MCL3861711.1 family 43 glycosylhydrolase [Actinotalea sp. K2]